MKRLLTPLLLSAVVFLGFASLASAAPRTYSFDRSHTEIGFNIRHLFTKVHGRFNDFTGKIVFDPEQLASSTVEVTIKDSSIYTANERRDNDLRSENFFWTEKHPTLTFKSTKVIPGKEKTKFQVQGDLTMRGVTKPVVLDVEFLGSGPVAFGGQSQGIKAGWAATTKIDRKDYGIIWNRTLDQGGTLLGDEVEIVINIEGISRDEAPAPPKETTTSK